MCVCVCVCVCVYEISEKVVVTVCRSLFPHKHIFMSSFVNKGPLPLFWVFITKSKPLREKEVLFPVSTTLLQWGAVLHIVLRSPVLQST